MIQYFEEQIEKGKPIDESFVKKLIQNRSISNIEYDKEYLYSKIGSYLLYFMLENKGNVKILKLYSDELDSILNKSTVKYHLSYGSTPRFIKL